MGCCVCAVPCHKRAGALSVGQKEMTVEGDQDADAWVCAEHSADSRQPATSPKAAKAADACIGDLDDADDDVRLFCCCSNVQMVMGLSVAHCCGH
jgi:hypothetical protein